MLSKLRDSHRQLEASAARLSDLLGAVKPDADALKAARWEIGTRIMQHMALEDRHLFANLVKDPRPGIAALALKHQRDFAQHMANYADHAKRWTADRVLSDWNGYRAMARKQLELLSGFIHKVETELFPLVATVSIDTPHAPSISWARDAFAIKDSITRGH